MLLTAFPTQAQVTTYCCDAAAEAQYLADLATLVPSAAPIAESFESGPWIPSRTGVQLSVTNQGITWSRSGHGVRTSVGGGDVHEGSYLFYAVQLTIPFHPVPDGFTVTSDGNNLHGVGGWYRGQGQASKIGFTVDGDSTRVDFTGEEATVNDWKFLGFIDTAAFTAVDIITVDEVGNETTIFFADDFNIAKAAPAVEGDYDGDGKADIFWRNESNGLNWLYTMDGNSILTSIGINIVNNFDFIIAGDGDYNGDGKADVLWRNLVTGQNWLFLMDGNTIAASSGVNNVPDLAWEIAADGDYNGDGKADILWRNSVSGQNWLYFMDGPAIIGSAGINTVNNMNFVIAGDGDYNGDGKADILWHNNMTGQNWIYLMDGATILTSAGVNTSDINLNVVGDGDYDGDGKADILLRNTVTGENWIYLMDGTSITSIVPVNTVASTDWRIIGDGDYNGDGTSDILWRNFVTGQNWVYLMNGGSIGTSVGINTVNNFDFLIIDAG
jgi:hypothetical protein